MNVKSYFGKVWQFLKKLNIDLPYDPAVLFLDIYPKELKKGIPIDPCTPMFITALFTIAKGPSTDEWINKMWYIHTTIVQPKKEIKF